MSLRADRQRLLARVEARFAELQALFVLARRYSAQRRALFDQLRGELPLYELDELWELYQVLSDNASMLADELGATRPLQEYVHLVAHMGAGEGQCAHMEKWRLKRLLRNHDACVPLAAWLPEHTQTSMDLT